MKILFRNVLLVLLFFSVEVAAETNSEGVKNWKSHWIEGVTYTSVLEFGSAADCFTEAITIIENGNISGCDHVYIDRARAFMGLEMFERALQDYEYALLRGNLSESDKVKAVVGKVAISAIKEDVDEFINNMDEWKKIDRNFPKIEIDKDFVVIRGAPDCECYKRLTKCFLIHSGMCESSKDILMTKSGVCIAKKLCDCGCEDCQKREQSVRICDVCGAELVFEGNGGEEKGLKEDIQKCKNWCSRIAVASGAWCARTFAFRPECTAACLLAVELLREGCEWCCAEGNFYERCVKPFEDIGAHMVGPCKPEEESK